VLGERLGEVAKDIGGVVELTISSGVSSFRHSPSPAESSSSSAGTTSASKRPVDLKYRRSSSSSQDQQVASERREAGRRSLELLDQAGF
jgi:hypothetical protein